MKSVFEKAEERARWLAELPDGIPCDHFGCLNHITHPCEVCGRIGGIRYKIQPNENEVCSLGGIHVWESSEFNPVVWCVKCGVRANVVKNDNP